MVGARRKKINRTIDFGTLRVHKTITLSAGLLQKLNDSTPLSDYIAMGLQAEEWQSRAIAAETSARDYEDRYKLFSIVLQSIEATHPELKDEIHNGIVAYKEKQLVEAGKLDMMG